MWASKLLIQYLKCRRDGFHPIRLYLSFYLVPLLSSEPSEVMAPHKTASLASRCALTRRSIPMPSLLPARLCVYIHTAFNSLITVFSLISVYRKIKSIERSKSSWGAGENIKWKRWQSDRTELSKERQREKRTVGFIERQKKTPVGLGWKEKRQA